MRQHICKKCGKIYLTDKPDSWYCPECAKESRSNVLVEKTCAICGNSFVGYPRSKYCSTCRIEVQREQARKRRKNGPSRKLGSIDICQACGKKYVVAGGLQRYCPECGETVVAETIREQKRKYTLEHKDYANARRAELRNNRKICVVCGKPFTSLGPSVTCSPECATEHKRRNQAVMDVRRGRASPARILGKMDRTNPQSGIPGITWHKQNQKWQLVIGKKYIGLFGTVEEALHAKRQMEEYSKNPD